MKTTIYATTQDRNTSLAAHAARTAFNLRIAESFRLAAIARHLDTYGNGEEVETIVLSMEHSGVYLAYVEAYRAQEAANETRGEVDIDAPTSLHNYYATRGHYTRTAVLDELMDAAMLGIADAKAGRELQSASVVEFIIDAYII